jgi:D-alanine-D-alanine ligase
MKVAVIEGGRSLERGVSLMTSVGTLRSLAPDAAFVAVHGETGEDGTVQQILDLMGIPYPGSSPRASAIAADKAATKTVLANTGLPTPEFISLSGDALRDLAVGSLAEEMGERLGWPLVVKPSRQGSALGISLAQSAADLPASLLSALSYDNHVMLEKWVPGRDLAVTVIQTDSVARALPIVEAIPVGDSYDFEARYEIGATRFECPTTLADEIAQKAAAIAVDAFEAVGCSGIARVDLMIDGEAGLWILEVDTVPGLTQTSLVPLAAETAGMSIDDLVEALLDSVLK